MISVVIPIYNAQRHLPRMLSCLQSQIYKDFEVILVDDGSEDASGLICGKITENDSRFVYIRQDNSGVSAARNRGMELARGAYITFLDADDEIEPDYLQVLLRTLEENDCPMAVCDVAVVLNGEEVQRFSCASGVLEQTEALNLLLSRRKINSGPCAKLFRREVLRDVAFPGLKAYEDILFVMDVMCRCSRIAVTDGTRYRYIQNSGSAMGSFLKTPSADVVMASERIFSFLKSRPELDPVCFYTTASHLMQYVQPLLGRAEGQAKRFVRQARKVYQAFLGDILRCPAFPWKEKIVYVMCACGLFYHGKKLYRLR